MTTEDKDMFIIRAKPVVILSVALVSSGVIAFLMGVVGGNAGRAWQAYLINFLLFSAVAQGAFLFSAVMHVTKARWSGPMAGVAESFAGFFPVSLGLFLLLLLGAGYLFPWRHMDLHGKQIWLNLPFLMGRDGLGLCLLYGIGLIYLYYSLGERLIEGDAIGGLRAFIYHRWHQLDAHPERRAHRKTVFAILYILTFTLVLSLLGYDLVMSLDPHWYSTLFGAYTFIKAFYVGLGGLIILASVLHLKAARPVGLEPAHFHDVGKLFLAFCLVWADFFYCQLVVIWYGNIPEEAAYVIERTMRMPYKPLAWTVFIVCFIAPFLILLNKAIKTRPVAMSLLCIMVLVGIWLEHLLLIGPALFPNSRELPVGGMDLAISMGFLGIMALTLKAFIERFPELVFQPPAVAEDKEVKG
jgi:hypothetical protein